MRAIAGDPHVHPAALTLSRATHLARDIALEQSDKETVVDAFTHLATAGIVESMLAARLATWIESEGASVYPELEARPDAFGELAMPIARDLDRFLRSIEHGAPAPEVPLDPISKAGGPAGPKPSSRSAVTILGRLFELAERNGQATVTLDEHPLPVGMRGTERQLSSFPLLAAPKSKPSVQHEPSGTTLVRWEAERFTLELTADLRTVYVRVESDTA